MAKWFASNAVNKLLNRVHNCKTNWDLHHYSLNRCVCLSVCVYCLYWLWGASSLYFVCFISIRLLSDFAITDAGAFSILHFTLYTNCITCEVYDIAAIICGSRRHHWQYFIWRIAGCLSCVHKQRTQIIHHSQYTNLNGELWYSFLVRQLDAAPCNK